ncbi:hypothetical protein AcV5_008214 [Taiwanofungus camphoratus]|nr:hypothetical protein AcV5_008214 [Antrodia cinnamomea]KAI0955584.1 hypothetical protein AcV7_006211 [Antrodia cinnamomea]
MNGSRPSSRVAGSILEDPMIPTHSQPPTSKRKGADDSNPLNIAVKKARKETANKSGPSNKRKLNGEEQPGGLVIVRAPAARHDALHIEPLPQTQPRAPSRPPSAPPLQQLTTDPSKQPSKKFKADGSTTSSRSIAKGKDRELYASTRAEPEVDEDVRLMQSETDTLRRQSQAAEQSVGALNPAFHFPSPKSNRQQPPPSNQRVHDASLPLPLRETPQIERNKVMRDGSHHRRKSSLSRGKRISTSLETTGIISQPHTSVSDSSFYKHIDGDLPEPSRARQLLIWCSYRAMNEPPEQAPQASSSKRRESKNSGKDPPPLSGGGMQVLKRVEERVIKLLAEKNIDTNVYRSGGERADAEKPKKENEQNVKNRAREIRFNAHIQRSKVEEDAWAEVSQHYNSYRAEVLAEIDKLTSAKAKGKQRAFGDDLDDWDVLQHDLPEYFRGSGNLDLARKIVSSEAGRSSSLSSRLGDLEYTIDRLHSITNCALETTRISEIDLDRRFALLNISLATRSQPVPTSIPSTSTALSSYLPPSLSRPPPTTDPQDLLRTLSRIDAQRPQTQVGDAARRAVREVQRANDASSGVGERRLTEVAPPTPRKPPGTPRRATTPGKGR